MTVEEARLLPVPPPLSPDVGLVFTTGWTAPNAQAVAEILAVHDPLREGDAAIRDTPEADRLVVVAWTDGQPMAFLAGRRIEGTNLALCSYFRGHRQWHGKYRVGLALWSQWLALCRVHDLETIVIGIDKNDPLDYRRRVERFVRLAGFRRYEETPDTTWYRLEVA